MNSYQHPTPEVIYEYITNTYLNSCEKRADFAKLSVKPFVPPKLYQYRSFDKDGHNINNLKNSKIWCSSVKNFNDLHEGTLKLPTGANLLYGFYKRNPNERKRFNNAWHRKPKEERDKIESDLKQLINDKTQNVFAVSCFTTNSCSNPMWAHYADKHTGFCVEFDFSLQQHPWFFPVAYSNEKIIYEDNCIGEPDCVPGEDCSRCEKDAFNKCFLTKGNDWFYEQEWRIFAKNPHSGKAINFLEKDFLGIPQDVSGCITGIYLGAMIGPENESQMIEVAKEKNLPIYKKVSSPDSFKLQYTLLWSPKSTMRN